MGRQNRAFQRPFVRKFVAVVKIVTGLRQSTLAKLQPVRREPPWTQAPSSHQPDIRRGECAALRRTNRSDRVRASLATKLANTGSIRVAE